jgi:hypothetical protein
MDETPKINKPWAMHQLEVQVVRREGLENKELTYIWRHNSDQPCRCGSKLRFPGDFLNYLEDNSEVAYVPLLETKGYRIEGKAYWKPNGLNSI